MSLTTYILGKIINEVGIGTIVNSASVITGTSKNIYNILSGIEKSGHISTGKISELDICITLRIVENMLCEIETDKIDSNTILISLESLAEIIKYIEADLDSVQKKIKHNGSLWIFKGMRSYDFDKEIKNLTLNKKILDRRLKLFFKLIGIKNELKTKHTNTLPNANLEMRLIPDYVNSVQ